ILPLPGSSESPLNKSSILARPWAEGVCYAKKDFNLAKHPDIDVPNLQVIKLMESFKSKDGPPRFDGDRPTFGDCEGYRAGPPGEFGGEKGGAPVDYQSSFGGGARRPAFGRGAGGFGGGAPGASGSFA
ncbi:40S ribosomal protein S10-3, partial [Bienertia sinuspersici]